MKDNGIKHMAFSTADGALEAAPAVRYTVCFIRFQIIKHIFDCSVFCYED
jgi:hypothetical protein